MSAILAFFLSPIGRLIGVGVLSALIAGVGVGWAVSTVKNGQIASIKAEQAQANAAAAQAMLKKFQDQAAVIVSAAQAYAMVQGDLDLKIGDIQKGLKSVIAKRPLAVGCKPDADRLRILTDAVAAANAASGSGSKPSGPVPPANGTH